MIPEDVFNVLKKIALTESDAWARLETALKEESQALERQDLAAITANTIQKEIAINGVKTAADKRKTLISNIGIRRGLNPPVFMDHLFGMASPEQRQEMSSWQAKFAAYAKNIHTLNQQNMLAIKTSLAVVSDCVRFLRNITEPMPNYTSGGKISARTLQGRVVSNRG